MNLLEILFLLILALMVIRGYHEGILRMFFGLVGCALICLMINQMNPLVMDYLNTKPKVKSEIHAIADKYVTGREDNAKENDSKNTNKNIIDESAEELPPFMRKYLVDELSKIDLQKDTEKIVQEKTHDAVVSTVENLLMNGLAVLVTLIVVSIIIGIVRLLLGVLGHLPIIHGTSKIVGALFGLFEGVFIIWILVFFIQSFSATNSGNALLKQVESSSWIMEINEYNPLIKIF